MLNIEKFRSDHIKKLYADKMEQGIVEDVLQASPAANVEDMWSRLRNVVETVAEQVIGRKGARRRNEWFDNECQIVLDAKNAARTKYLQRATRATQEDYKRKRAVERRMFRTKKDLQEHVLIASIEHLSSEKDTRGLYQ